MGIFHCVNDYLYRPCDSWYTLPWRYSRWVFPWLVHRPYAHETATWAEISILLPRPPYQTRFIYQTLV